MKGGGKELRVIFFVRGGGEKGGVRPKRKIKRKKARRLSSRRKRLDDFDQPERIAANWRRVGGEVTNLGKKGGKDPSFSALREGAAFTRQPRPGQGKDSLNLLKQRKRDVEVLKREKIFHFVRFKEKETASAFMPLKKGREKGNTELPLFHRRKKKIWEKRGGKSPRITTSPKGRNAYLSRIYQRGKPGRWAATTKRKGKATPRNEKRARPRRWLQGGEGDLRFFQNTEGRSQRGKKGEIQSLVKKKLAGPLDLRKKGGILTLRRG